MRACSRSRLKCLRPLTNFHSYFGIVLPSLISDEGISPQPQLLNIKGNQIVNLPGIVHIVHRENYDTLEWVSPYVQSARSGVEFRPNLHPEPNSSLPEILEDKLIESYNVNNSNENSIIIGIDQLSSIYLNTNEIKYS